ncbi:hypoxanthine phosphoribosyltransferase [Parvibaculum lavamentivorans DS-1]|uniref:Hypoxanthine phosphoribosyltransferase n=1 Tax=Parvibaculum lavamentivorans (strain DS-1 / DSM 13023 / NCIMB 13966) TaxID=402881 RepID=A7HTI3_PARL1|nr:hypoxanthine phosphoribosyltransferase [Parvibaculum lavamentivorans]ABS63216.1 hypoxanthine phosphoribosyltransferase [Parvibaculum lavamentivorans DS-1]
MSSLAPKGARIKVLYPAEEIAARVRALAADVSAAAGADPLVIPILKGSFIFAADLLRALHEAGVEPDMDFISLSSYGAGTTSLGEVRIVRDTEAVVSGRDVLIVDDILESGRTLAFAKDLMAARGARSVRTCVLLRKPGKLAVDIEADFVGFDCPDRFVVGYGMDVAHAFRQLPFVGYVEP